MDDDKLRSVTTKDGRRLVIRKLCEADRDALLVFGAHLPKDDWLYLDVELQTPSTITRLVNAVEARNWRQVVAVDGDVIVGYANVRQLPGWKRHVGDIALVVRDDYRRHGIGAALGGAVLDSAAAMSLTKLIVEVVQDATGGQLIFKRLGFHQEGLFVDHAIDYLGNPRDIVQLSYQVPTEVAS